MPSTLPPHRLLALLTAAAMLVPLPTFLGCGEAKPTDAERIWAIVANMSDITYEQESFESLFVDGAAPDESARKRYRQYFYSMDRPEISRNEAAVTVRVMNAGGEVLSETEWKFSSGDGEEWKISDAPLPP